MQGHELDAVRAFFGLTVGIGEIIAIGILGNMLCLALLRYGNKLFPEGGIA